MAILAEKVTMLRKKLLIYFLALKPTQCTGPENLNQKELEAKYEKAAINFLTEALDQLQTFNNFLFTANVLKVLIHLLDDAESADCYWLRQVLELIFRISKTPLKYHINRQEMKYLHSCISELKNIPWGIFFCYSILDFVFAKLFLNAGKKIRPNWITFGKMTMKRIYKIFSSILSARINSIQNEIDGWLCRQDLRLIHGKTKSSKKKNRRLNHWLEIHILLLQSCPRIKWSFFSVERLQFFFHDKFAIKTKIRFWLALIRACPDRQTFEFSTNLLTSMLANSNLCLQGISKKLLDKLSDKYLKIVLQAFPQETTCIDEQNLIALSTLLFENPLNESLKIPQVLHFLTHRFGLGILMKKLQLKSLHSEKLKCFKDIWKQLNVDLDDDELNLIEDENARISFLSIKGILAFPEAVLSENDESWLIQLAFTRSFWSLSIWARHQTSLAIDCCSYKRLDASVSLRMHASSEKEKVKIALGKQWRRPKVDYRRRKKDIVKICPGILYLRKLQGYSYSVFDDITLKGYSTKHSLWCSLHKTDRNQVRETLKIGRSTEQTLSIFQTLSFWGSRHCYFNILGYLLNEDKLPLILQSIYHSRRFNLDHHEIPYLEEEVKKYILMCFFGYHDQKIMQSCMLEQPAFPPFN